MKNLIRFQLFIVATFVLLFVEILHANPTLQKLENTSIPEFKIPNIKRQHLKNGVRLLTLPNHDVPVVRGYIYLQTGSIYEPADQVGVAEMLGDMLREGGTLRHSADEIDQMLSEIGAEVESDIGREYGLIVFKCLKEDYPKVLQLIFEMLREPRFDPARLTIVKLKSKESIRRQEDDPSKLALREFPKMVYGKDNVWGRTPSLASIDSISRENIVSFYQRSIFPDRLLLAIYGDFSSDKELKKVINPLIDGWNRSREKLPNPPPLEKDWKREALLIPKKIDQATLIFGHFGDKRFNPDKYALIMLNDILGGDTLVSRLGKEIRSNQGLVYGVYSRFGLETDFGLFYIMAQTKSPTAVRVFEESQRIVHDLQGKIPVGEDELRFHRQSLLNSLFSDYEPSYNILKDEARFWYFGYPPHYLEFFKKNVERVTVEDLSRVAEKYLRPEDFKLLVIGDPEKLGGFPQ